MIFFFLMIRRPPRSTLFPTRRSSDLFPAEAARRLGLSAVPLLCAQEIAVPGSLERVIRLMVHCYAGEPQDRKSTRLNSSHANISYAVFCLKKKKTQSEIISTQE